MESKNSNVSKDDQLAKIDNMLLQLINEAEESRNNSLGMVHSYREEFFAKCTDIINDRV